MYISGSGFEMIGSPARRRQRYKLHHPPSNPERSSHASHYPTAHHPTTLSITPSTKPINSSTSGRSTASTLKHILTTSRTPSVIPQSSPTTFFPLSLSLSLPFPFVCPPHPETSNRHSTHKYSDSHPSLCCALRRSFCRRNRHIRCS